MALATLLPPSWSSVSDQKESVDAEKNLLVPGATSSVMYSSTALPGQFNGGLLMSAATSSMSPYSFQQPQPPPPPPPPASSHAHPSSVHTSNPSSLSQSHPAQSFNCTSATSTTTTLPSANQTFHPFAAQYNFTSLLPTSMPTPVGTMSNGQHTSLLSASSMLQGSGLSPNASGLNATSSLGLHLAGVTSEYHHHHKASRSSGSSRASSTTSSQASPSTLCNTTGKTRSGNGSSRTSLTTLTNATTGSNSSGGGGGGSSSVASSTTPNQISVECVVCGDKSSGKHYGQFTCEGCKSFFKRSVRRNLSYTCRGNRNCPVDQHHRNQCQYCRLKKCIKMGMRREAVQRGRIPLTPTHSNFGPGSGHHSVLSAAISAAAAAAAVGLSPTGLQTSPTAGTTVNGLEHHHNGTMGSAANNSGGGAGRHGSMLNGNQSAAAVAAAAAAASSNGSYIVNSLVRAEPGVQDLNQYLQTHSGSGGHLSYEHLCEFALGIFMNTLKWVKNIPYFPDLSLADQTTMLRFAWSDLFILSASQCSLPVNSMTASVQISPFFSEQMLAFVEYVKALETIIEKLKGLHLDSAEYSCLKAIVLFNTDVAGLSDGSKVEKFQENCQSALEEYCRVHYPGQGLRFGKLLLRLPSFKTINSQVIEKLFFFRLGKTSMDTFIHDMVHGGASNLWQPSYIPLQ